MCADCIFTKRESASRINTKNAFVCALLIVYLLKMLKKGKGKFFLVCGVRQNKLKKLAFLHLYVLCLEISEIHKKFLQRM